jgi:hypothetical protein
MPSFSIISLSVRRQLSTRELPVVVLLIVVGVLLLRPLFIIERIWTFEAPAIEWLGPATSQEFATTEMKLAYSGNGQVQSCVQKSRLYMSITLHIGKFSMR